MARGLNKVMLIGRIQPNDPELRYTQNGQPVCTFKLVTDESYKDRDGNMVERSEWHNIVFWGKAGEIISQYMKKGSQIFIEGRIQTRKYEDKDGQTRYITEINGVLMGTYIEWMRSCYYISITGLPAISVPCGFTPEGLPIGLQIVGRHQDELGVLQLAYAFEQATGFWRMRPEIAG